jgi:hypothetical protein
MIQDEVRGLGIIERHVSCTRLETRVYRVGKYGVLETGTSEEVVQRLHMVADGISPGKGLKYLHNPHERLALSTRMRFAFCTIL